MLDAEHELAPGNHAAVVGDVDEHLEVGAETIGGGFAEFQHAVADVVCEPVCGREVVGFRSRGGVSDDDILVIRVGADRGFLSREEFEADALDDLEFVGIRSPLFVITRLLVGIANDAWEVGELLVFGIFPAFLGDAAVDENRVFMDGDFNANEGARGLLRCWQRPLGLVDDAIGDGVGESVWVSGGDIFGVVVRFHIGSLVILMFRVFRSSQRSSPAMAAKNRTAARRST